MRKKTHILTLSLVLVLLCSACGALPNLFGGGRLATHSELAAQRALKEGLEAQLGLLSRRLNTEERQACMDVWSELWPLRQARLERGLYDAGERESRLARRLRKLLDGYTVAYLDGSEDGFGYLNPPMEEVASYTVGEGDEITSKGDADEPEDADWTQADLEAMWDYIRGILPDGAFENFSRFDVFTDGPEETLAYVYAADAFGKRWVLAVDPADADDGDYFTETILHEYFHYLSLNADQVTYTSRLSADTYSESGLVSHPGSYIDDFYQAFWTDYIDDCLAGDDTYNFFLRHYDDFVSAYASTDPSEDICESFTYFVLWERGRVYDVWEAKLDFFYQYPELVEFRAAVRENLNLDV